MKFLTCLGLLLIIITPLFTKERSSSLVRIDVSHLLDRSELLIVEHARTQEKRQWGLMGRQSLPENQGLLLYLSQAPLRKIWMFNCLFDLSIAVIDKHGIIRDLQDLAAYPHMMDPDRPINHLHDLALYPKNDPIIQFFQKKSFPLPPYAAYVLEMNKSWFDKHHVKIGDALVCEPVGKQDFILCSHDLSHFVPLATQPLLLEFKSSKPRSVWIPKSDRGCDIALLDDHYRLVKMMSFPKMLKSQLPPVLFSKKSVKYILMAPLHSIGRQDLALDKLLQ